MKAPQAKSRVEGRASNKPRSARQFPWTKEEDALLGKLTDHEVAEKLNRTLGAVRDRPNLLGKAALAPAPQPFHMEPEPGDHYAQLFATKSTQELRASLGWSYKLIYTRQSQPRQRLRQRFYDHISRTRWLPVRPWLRRSLRPRPVRAGGASDE